MRKVKQNQNFTRSPFTVVVYVIQYHLAAAEAELVNIESQMDPEGGAVSSVPAEAGEVSHGTFHQIIDLGIGLQAQARDRQQRTRETRAKYSRSKYQ